MFLTIYENWSVYMYNIATVFDDTYYKAAGVGNVAHVWGKKLLGCLLIFLWEDFSTPNLWIDQNTAGHYTDVLGLDR